MNKRETSIKKIFKIFKEMKLSESDGIYVLCICLSGVILLDKIEKDKVFEIISKMIEE